MTRRIPGVIAISQAQSRSTHEIAKAMNVYATEVVAEQAVRPITKNEWINAFYGDFEAGLAQARKMERIENIRHRLAEPFMRLNPLGKFTREVGVIVRPNDYNPSRPESFLSYSIEKQGNLWRGVVSCRAFVDVPKDHSDEYGATEDQLLNLLITVRSLAGDSPRASDDLVHGPDANVVIGLKAISQFAETRANDYPDMWPQRVAMQRLRGIYDFAGDLVMSPPAFE